MFSNGRKTIGVFLEASTGEFQRLLCKGVIEEAKERGYNVAVFHAYGKYGENNRHFRGDQSIYELAPWEELDGIVLLLDTMLETDSRETVLRGVKRSHCPVVSVREIVDGANNLLVDNTTCMEGILRHFIEHHKFQRICFMTGPESHWDAVERLACFERVMKEYGLPVDDHQKFYGDYWTNMGGAACDWFMEGQERPQAIVCANDYMALSVISELIGRGIQVPGEICVSGYDGLNDTMAFTPTVTTVTVPFYKMGVRAMEIIDEKQGCPEQVENVYFEAELALRETCGCMKANGLEVLTEKRRQYEEAKISHNRDVQFDYVSIHLGDCSTLEEIADILSYYRYNIAGMYKYGICLCENLLERDEHKSLTEKVELRIAMKGEDNFGELRIGFDRKELVPAILTDDEPQVWYFAPLHFQDNIYGYEMLNFQDPNCIGNLYFRWNINIGNKIRDILVEYKMQKLIHELEDMYDRDALTGMYNRRGWGNYSNVLFQQAKEQKQTIFLAVIDLDGMKTINDNFGHDQGDFALKKMEEAIRNVCRKDYISARTGGDEFVILAKGITTAEGELCLQKLEDFLEDFNASGEKEYEIHASTGFVCRIPTLEESIETYTKESDGAMYQNKVLNKAKRGETLR